ncbi:Alpha/Beta hydrolase protein [Panaeolus papilionaceus]|nr:Alpha/Beta hydrolase protein [Panaeolus papilionaceus]
MDVLPPAREIPAAFTSSFRSWQYRWSAANEKESAISEERLIRRALPFFRSSYTPPSSKCASKNTVDTDTPPPAPTTPDSDGPLSATSSKVHLSKPKHYINTLSITSNQPSPTAPPPAVMLHGYGAGLGFYFHNLPTMASWAASKGSSVYALDWLGMGRSARVPFKITAKRDDTPARVAEAESFFIDSLEEWRSKMGLKEMTLIGHSLGAYFSVAYALKYPDRVNKLILLSPAGVPRGPNYTEPSRELTDEGDSASSASGGRSTVQRATPANVKDIREEQKEKKAQESRTRKLLTYLWEEGWSPFQVVRSTLFFSPMLIGKYSTRRFQDLTPAETRDVHDYIMNITLAKGSGEYCISHILAPGAHARIPLVDRVKDLKKDLPVTFVYGDHDWMDPVGGFASVENMKKAGNDNGRMFIVTNAGHHVYLDNKEQVNELLLEELDR